jgi:hypothetical protein
VSLDITFIAVEQGDASELVADPTTVDAYIRQERGFKFTLALTGQWEHLSAALGRVGFRSSHFIDEVLSNGCEVVESDLVFRQAEELKRIDPMQLQSLLAARSARASEVAHQMKSLQALVEFYKKASGQSLAVLYFAQ